MTPYKTAKMIYSNSVLREQTVVEEDAKKVRDALYKVQQRMPGEKRRFKTKFKGEKLCIIRVQ